MFGRPAIAVGILLLVTAQTTSAEEAKSKKEGEKKVTDQTMASSFLELREHLKVGDTVYVTEDSGDIVKGKIRSLSLESTTLQLEKAERTLVDSRGRPRNKTTRHKSLDISEAQIQKVELEIADSNWNGALWGALAGIGLAAAGAQGCCGNPDYGPEYAFLVGAPLMGGLGALLGYGIDGASKKRQLILSNERPSSVPEVTFSAILTKGHKGVVVILAF